MLEYVSEVGSEGFTGRRAFLNSHLRSGRMAASEPNSFVSTGVPGLDHVLLGGFLREGFYLVQGDPGSGKTTVALQFALGRLRAGERCLYITLTESRRDLENACVSHGWTLGDLEICD